MAATLRYGRERALLARSLLNFIRIARDAHAPDLTLGEGWQSALRRNEPLSSATSATKSATSGRPRVSRA